MVVIKRRLSFNNYEEREKEKALENSKGGATFVRATNFDVRVSFAMHTGSLCRSYVVAFCHSDHQTTSVVPRYSKGKLFLHNSEDKTNESNKTAKQPIGRRIPLVSI